MDPLTPPQPPQPPPQPLDDVALTPPAQTRRWVSVLAAALWLLPAGASAWAIARAYSTPAPAALDRSEAPDGSRYGLTLERRKALWDDIARHHEGWKKIGKRDFPRHLWSQFDHYAAHNSQHLAYLAGREQLSYAVLALVWDEGVHARWPIPDTDKTIPATWTPLSPRLQ